MPTALEASCSGDQSGTECALKVAERLTHFGLVPHRPTTGIRRGRCLNRPTTGTCIQPHDRRTHIHTCQTRTMT
eukprot:7046677-Prymnesium_polylepis.1